MKTKTTPARTLEVEVGHVKNPDICGGYWEEPVVDGRVQRVPIADFAEASEVCSEYIDRNGLGSGNWSGGRIFENGEQVARVSYNGKVWAGNDWVPGAKPMYPVEVVTP